MVSKSFVDQEIRNAFGDHSIQVGWQASEMLVRFLWDVAEAVSKETRRQFQAYNESLGAEVEPPGVKKADLKPRKRVWDKPVVDAIRKVLAQPEVHLPKWFSRRPPRPPRR